MARIVMAWELGGGMGHVVPLSQIAQALVARGHDVHFVLRDLSGAAEALRGLARHPQVRLWQAPVWLAQLTGAPLPVSYAELLFRAGYLDARRLSGLADAWRSLFDALQPQLLVADHAPTALLAARGRPMARALVGTGFFVPPATTPMPAFRDWDRPDAARLAQSEARALASCNALLASWQQPPMDTLQILGGRKEKIRPGDILGALTGEAGFKFEQVGKINITEFHSYVAVERSIAREAVKRLSEGKIKGRKAKVRRMADLADLAD